MWVIYPRHQANKESARVWLMVGGEREPIRSHPVRDVPGAGLGTTTTVNHRLDTARQPGAWT
ncbi:hypothetical protein BO70DRAFT_363093 [Aspergillus heteromorphus CBS 117.55]|uniref:Uncharacterized protein n=1 Tax=Aspergillus heteromorphus CBS 117.55 TaxID=1448321 RepID=A0A317VZ10_9EURO|nr:uncharacterized protein BO70DRAFT_363093 [Aspergillus heteromorphus CBS 117.55]PWY78197.1 hypothetical protein BO70DRAFT_363093 [Aspergillus heteromorphus CBS 117.55]